MTSRPAGLAQLVPAWLAHQVSASKSHTLGFF